MAAKVPPCTSPRHKYKGDICDHCGYNRNAGPVLPPPPPRPDGLIEHRIRYEKVGIGHVIWSKGRKWTVIEARQPAQYDYGRICWLRVQAPQGETHNIPPKLKRDWVTVLLPEGGEHPVPAYADGEIETALLESMLGGVEIATKDDKTGEVWCPWHPGVIDDNFAAELLHLQVGHGMDTTGITVDIETMTRVHAQAHDRKWGQIGKGGFAHRHVPEDLSIT